ncbi:MAG: SWIM zinc finger family protein [Prochloraceae cyanobacterium]
MMTLKLGSQQSLTIPSLSSDQFHNALLAVLPQAEQILRYDRAVGRGKVYWAYYRTEEGKKRATFISPKEFQGYRWFDDFSTVVNLENGSTYQVSDKYCTCRSWEYQVKTGKKSQCKHQVMRSSLAGSGGDRSREIKVQINSFLQNNSLHIAAKSCNSDIKLNSPLPPAPCPPASSTPLLYNPSNRYKLNPEILLDGFELERSRDLTLKEYYLKAWSKQHLKAEPELKRIARIIETDRGFMVGGMRGASRVTVAFQADAVGWLLRYNGIDYNKDIVRAFQEYQKSKKPCCHKCGTEFEIVLSWENEPDYCPNCGWVEKELSEIEKRRLAREERRLNAAIAAKKKATKKNSQVNVVEAFGGFL